jgi:hypothetical protein
VATHVLVKDGKSTGGDGGGSSSGGGGGSGGSHSSHPQAAHSHAHSHSSSASSHSTPSSSSTLHGLAGTPSPVGQGALHSSCAVPGSKMAANGLGSPGIPDLAGSMAHHPSTQHMASYYASAAAAGINNSPYLLNGRTW